MRKFKRHWSHKVRAHAYMPETVEFDLFVNEYNEVTECKGDTNLKFTINTATYAFDKDRYR
jgi:hypothetical protein